MSSATLALAQEYGDLTAKTAMLIAQVRVMLDLYHDNGFIHHETEEAVEKTMKAITEKSHG